MPRQPARTLALRPPDPFDLIRWLARSQSDPRKAAAEPVQNSRLPQYDLPAVPGGRGESAEAAARTARGAGAMADDGEPQAEDGSAAVVAPELFPPGPIASARIVPERVEVVPGRERRVGAEALDGDGRRIRSDVTYALAQRNLRGA